MKIFARFGFGRWPLSRQLATILAGVMLFCATLIIIGNETWGYYEGQRIMSQLTPAQARAMALIEQNKLPDAADLLSLNKKLNAISAELDSRSNLVLGGSVMAGALLAFLLGYILLGRIGTGLDNVGRAARDLADGDLSARAVPMALASREETQLALDFNHMADSLQRAERELAEGTAAIAHELRTPLTILRGRLHGVADGVFGFGPDEIRGLLFQVEGLGRIVDDLQTLSLANSDRMLLDCQPTDLAEEVARVLSTARPDLEAAGLHEMLSLEPAKAIIDGARIRQVIGAILSNAQRYAPDSGILRISTIAEAEHVVLEIVDHGPGLSNDGQTQAFDRFWRGEPSRSRNAGGSGLGLAVVKAIVIAHGGTVSLRNHNGGGVIFTMRLPKSPSS